MRFPTILALLTLAGCTASLADTANRAEKRPRNRRFPRRTPSRSCSSSRLTWRNTKRPPSSLCWMPAAARRLTRIACRGALGGCRQVGQGIRLGQGC